MKKLRNKMTFGALLIILASCGSVEMNNRTGTSDNENYRQVCSVETKDVRSKSTNKWDRLSDDEWQSLIHARNIY